MPASGYSGLGCAIWQFGRAYCAVPYPPDPLLSVTAYFESILKHLEATGGPCEDSPVASVNDEDTQGTFTATVVYSNGCQLHVDIAVSVELGWPAWSWYSFHL